MKAVRFLAVIALSLSLSSGCAVLNKQAQHPGAVDAIDNTAYNALLVYHDGIESAKADLTKGTLPDTAKPVLNILIDAYNTLQKATDAYHQAGLAGAVPADTLQKVSNAEAAAAAAFAELVKIYPKAGAKK